MERSDKMKDFTSKGLKFLKIAGPVILAGTIAVIQAIGEQLDAKRIDVMEDRIKALENR
jgi:hypothetical protein